MGRSALAIYDPLRNSVYDTIIYLVQVHFDMYVKPNSSSFIFKTIF